MEDKLKITKNMKNYDPLVIPLNKPIEELTLKETREYFEWYLSHIDERSDYLREKVSQGLNISVDQLDFSFESLKLIWKWFLEVAELEKTSFDFFKKNQQKDFSVFTHYVIRDIAMYVGKLFTMYSPIIKWTFITKPKSYVYVNEPILIGFIDDDPDYPKPFHPDLNPLALVHICALSIMDNEQMENDLFDDCLRWKNWIPNKADSK